MEKRALIAMSGGVDSSVSAALMREKGYDCIGVMMKLFQNETVDIPKGHTCCSLDDAEDARRVAFRLEMPFYVFNFTDDFAGQVIDRFVAAYETGATPNPCIDCNRYMKFDKLLLRAQELGCDLVVTGHYARVEEDGNVKSSVDKFYTPENLEVLKEKMDAKPEWNMRKRSSVGC